MGRMYRFTSEGIHGVKWALKFREVEWLEINPIVLEHIGRLVKPKQHNYLENIIAHLKSEGISHSIKEGMIRIPFSELSEQYS